MIRNLMHGEANPRGWRNNQNEPTLLTLARPKALAPRLSSDTLVNVNFCAQRDMEHAGHPTALTYVAPWRLCVVALKHANGSGAVKASTGRNSYRLHAWTTSLAMFWRR